MNVPLSRRLKILGLVACLALSACGFHLRGSEGTSFERNLYVEGPGTGSSFFGTFGTALTGAGGKLANAAAGADGVVYLYQALYWRQPITLSRTGLASGYDLSYRIVYEVRSPKGEVLQPRKEFEVKRDYFNNQTLPLAQLYEEGTIREELEKEAAQSLLRRVVNLLKQPHDSSPQPLDKKS